MTDIALPLIIAAVVLVVVLAVAIPLLVSASRRRKTTDTGPRDANDPAPAPTTTVPMSADEGAPVATGPPGTGADALATEDAEAPAETALERPEPVQGRLARLRARLSKSNNVFGKGLLALLSRETIDEDVWDEIEITLLSADLGTDATDDLMLQLRARVKVEGSRTPERVKEILTEELLELVDPSMDRSLSTDRLDDKPSVILVVGVNGVGKTTTIGKLARVLVAEDKDVLLGAADTFRAAAAEQLATWGARVGVPTVKSSQDGADPASVAFDAVKAGVDAEVDVVMVDTAGRLQNKSNLMDELGKIKRVIEKTAPVRETLLVLDATTGQNGLQQAKVFAEVVDITGIVLTKLDGTAKGGIVVAMQRQLGVPVKLIGLGEGPDDLAPFEPQAFVDAILD
ncbi:signal recognition particle-docking protein FtsY [Galactobacter caseinivorans]|uniref:Signal recognition particle receptor FtsY n=1 Tax=Galactobacter caseinivorans TaxID=2676123 RepID=A0A496PGU2_9MICC|nr:signal recognition particle-docking protein FtsY [Galactobacter caseinivorans]RKW69700.1 signal recognition particle-docking protein FtsY [Galactobacter caseinivorans]